MVCIFTICFHTKNIQLKTYTVTFYSPTKSGNLSENRQVQYIKVVIRYQQLVPLESLENQLSGNM